MKYNGDLTREQFLLDESRVIAKLITRRKSKEEVMHEVYKSNLF